MSAPTFPQEDVRQMGARVYHKLTPQQREELREYLLTMLSIPQGQQEGQEGLSPARQDPSSGSSNSKSWREVVEDATSAVIERRAATSDASLEAADVVQEVLPIAHASVPAAVRRELFLRIKSMIRQQQQQ